MMLCDKTIEQYCKKYGLISPFFEYKLQPSSYDLTLDNLFYDDKTETYIQDDKFCLYPNEFILASTVEKVNIPNNMVGRVEGKSSLGRIGLLTHITAGFIDAGFKGNITLELKNIGNKPIHLMYACDIAQICFIQLDEECNIPYNNVHNNYQFQSEVTKSRYECKDGVYIVR